MSGLNALVLAEIRRDQAEAKLKYESVLAEQRKVPSLVGRSNQQLALQRKAKELKDQLDTWNWLVAVAQHEETAVPFKGFL